VCKTWARLPRRSKESEQDICIGCEKAAKGISEEAPEGAIPAARIEALRRRFSNYDDVLSCR
jgi:hypothetical protein